MERASSEWIDWAGSRDLHVDLAPRGDRRAALERSVRAGDPRRPPGRRRPPALDARAGRRPRPRARDGRRGLRAAHRRGLPDGAAGRADAGGLRRHRRRPAGTARDARRPAPGSRARHARRQRLPARGLAARAAARLRRRARQRARLPRPARPPGAARRARRLPRALARRGRRPRPDRRLRGLQRGPGAAARGAAGRHRWRMEDPCLDFHRAIVRAAGREIVPMAVDERRRAAGGRRGGRGAVLLTPAHQFPLGATLAPERRAAFVGWARERGTVVIEDDYDGEFRYDRQPAGALQGLDPEHVVYAGTASKTLAPGLRLAWLVLPGALVEPVLEAKTRIGGTTVLEQLALAELHRLGRPGPARAADAVALPAAPRRAARAARRPPHARASRPACTWSSTSTTRPRVGRRGRPRGRRAPGSGPLLARHRPAGPGHRLRRAARARVRRGARGARPRPRS